MDDDLQKLFVNIQKDTGFRARVTLDLRYHNVKEDLESETENQENSATSPRKLKDYCHVNLPPQSYTGRKRAGITFIGPNSVSFLRQLIKKGVVTPNPATCEPPDPSHRKEGKCTCTRLFPWRYQSIREALRLAMNKAGLDPKLQPTHGLRKFYEDALGSVRPGMDVHLKA